MSKSDPLCLLLRVLYFQVLHLGLWPILTLFLYMVWGNFLISSFYIYVSSFPCSTCWRDCLFSIVYSCLICHIIMYYRCMALFLASVLCSTNLCLCVHVCAQSCLTLWDPMDCSPPGSSVHGMFQARILEWFSISHSKGSSRPRDQTHVSWVSCIGSPYHGNTWEALFWGKHHAIVLFELLQGCPILTFILKSSLEIGIFCCSSFKIIFLWILRLF